MRTPRKMLAAIVVGFGLAGVVAAPAPASGGPGHRDRSGESRSSHEPRLLPARIYLPEAAQSNQFEIVTGQLAQERGQSSAVKALGAMFVGDHTALLQQGAQVAQQLGIPAPTTLDARRQAIVDRLRTLSGARFDAAWLRVQLAAHQQALGLNLFAAIRGENAAIRTLGQGALPVITKHFGELLDIAQSTKLHREQVAHDAARHFRS
jgi:predicted outer membrane protein